MTNTKQTHKITVTAMLGAVATVLMFLDFPMPFLIPSFVKMDFSELPALLATFSIGPASGVAVCFLKNAVNCLHTTTGCIGELSNFLLGCCFVLPTGLLYRKCKTRKGALLGSLVGMLVMGILSVPINYYISYPIYAKLTPIDTIIGLYQALIPSVDGLLACLVVFNAPFTMFKGLLDTALAFLIYKPLSPLLHQ